MMLLDKDAFQGRLVDHVFGSVAWPAKEYPSWVEQANRTSLNGQAVPLCDPHWTSERRGEDLILVNPWRERSVACNPPAAAVLSLCDGARSVDGIVQHLASGLGHPADELGRHVRETLLELNELGVVKWKRPSGGDEPHFRPEWVNVSGLDELELCRRIKYSVQEPEDFVPEPSLVARVGQAGTAGRALDVGCGLGRNMRGLVEKYPQWTVAGYDNPTMLARAAEWLPRHLSKMAGALLRTSLCNDWNDILARRFDLAFVCLVLQHMRRQDALKVLRDVSRITFRLVVVSREHTDDNEDVMDLIRESACWELVEREDDPPGSCHPGHWAGELRSRFPVSRS